MSVFQWNRHPKLRTFPLIRSQGTYCGPNYTLYVYVHVHVHIQYMAIDKSVLRDSETSPPLPPKFLMSYMYAGAQITY